jgi:hypothetical protein
MNSLQPPVFQMVLIIMPLIHLFLHDFRAVAGWNPSLSPVWAGGIR